MKRLFDFKCMNCEHTYEVFIHWDDLVKCPRCGTENQKKLLKVKKVSCQPDGMPRNDHDMEHYFGDGQYAPGYKRGM